MNTQKYLREENQDPSRYRTWQSVLDSAGIDTEAYLNTKNSGRLKKDVESALETLYDIEAIDECSATIYHADDRAILDNLPRKGAMKAWLQLRVCIDPPADVNDALRQPNAKRIARAIEIKAALEGNEKTQNKRQKTKKVALKP